MIHKTLSSPGMGKTGTFEPTKCVGSENSSSGFKSFARVLVSSASASLQHHTYSINLIHFKSYALIILRIIKGFPWYVVKASLGTEHTW